jgi:deoxyhypusine monooxygenase
MQDPHPVPSLIDRLSDAPEDVLVRHEAAEALRAIGDMIAIDTLRKFQDDSEVVVAESCEVAIDLLNYVSSKELNYS